MTNLPYQYPNGTENFTEWLSYVNDVTRVGGDFAILGNGVPVVVFVVAFMALANFEAEDSITTSAFMAAISAYLLNIVGWASKLMPIAFTIITIGSILIFYVRRSSTV